MSRSPAHPTKPVTEVSRARRRRTPDEAREEILAAADRLLSQRGPEQVGLKDVAREVGVTHGLVVHYFGSYAGLVRAVLGRRSRVAVADTIARLLEARESLSFDGLNRQVFSFVADRLRARLLLWLSFQEEKNTAEPTPEPGRQLRAMIDLVEQMLPELRLRQGKPPLPRVEIERLALFLLVAGQGYASSGDRWWRALGRSPSPALDDEFRELLRSMIEAYLDRAAQS